MSDWTGGLANREYRRGAHVEQAITPEVRAAVMRQVRSYLGNCREYGISSQYHPTPEGALKIVHGPRVVVLSCYREATVG